MAWINKIRYLFRLLKWRTHFPKRGSLAWKIKNAAPLDEIIIEPGIYRENITLKTSVRLRGKEVNL